MMSDKRGMKLIWKIVNFNCIKGGILNSPSFPWNDATWEVVIHLTDETIVDDFFKVEIHQLEFRSVSMSISFALLDSQGYPLVWENDFMYFRDVAKPSRFPVKFPKLLKGSELFGSRRNEFLPNDTLTVQCHMRNRSSDTFFDRASFIAHTRIEPLVTKKIFIWDVTDALSRKCGPFEREESMTINSKPLVMKLLLECDDGALKVKITVTFIRVHLGVTISLLDIFGKKVQLVNDGFPFEKNGQEWNLGTVLKENMLKCYKCAFLSNDSLSLHFSCTLSLNITFNSLVGGDEMAIMLPNVEDSHSFKPKENTGTAENETSSRSDHSGTVSKAIQGFLSECDLEAGDRLFPVHKDVRGMSSPVFRALFTTETQGKEDNCAVIEDVDVNTLHRMLKFIYSDKLEEDMGWERASSLYETADKYAMETLNHRCSAVLRSGLGVDCVLDVLKLANMYQDQELKSSAFEFISLNDSEIVGSERWNRFEGENKELGLDTLRSLYLYFKKMIK